MLFRFEQRLDADHFLVKHAEVLLTARVIPSAERLEGTTAHAELGFEAVVSSRILPEGRPIADGLFREGPNVRIGGQVHHRLETGDAAIYEIRSRQAEGSLQATFDSTEVGEWQVGDIVETVVRGLTLYDTNL